MTELPEFIAELEKHFGKVVVTTKRSQLYPDDWKTLKVVEPLREPPEHEPRTAYKAYLI